ncbi:PDZ/DHR/GLGF domain protein [Trichinella nativa]|uniref:PDZ/DHR/GLGF domain protein n=1 Tax=Trichinella nativa TaxID=6335 RepID=A0A1Y3EW39_9BILA|nr:PDZ/DHR/GLGF domain protein [Trichinella nativa]
MCIPLHRIIDCLLVESFRMEKVQPSGVLAKRSEVSPLNASGGVCSELTTSMPTESPKKEFTMIIENKTLEQATTSLQENKQLANSFDRKLSLEDSGHFGGESDDTDERLSASPGTLDSPSSNVTRLNININGKQDVKLLTMGNYGLQKPENGIRRVSADGSELTYVCNLVRFQKERNFGFTLKGGLNSGEPLRIDQVTPGLSADRAGVKAGDILVSVNGALVRDDLIGKANMMIKEAVFVSHVELVLEKSEKEQSETNSAISTPRKLSSSSKDFTATGQSNSTNWFLQRRAMFEKLCAAESDVHLAKTDFRRSYRRTPSDCCPTLIRNYDLGNCNTNLAVGMALPSYRDEISFVDFEAEPDDASLIGNNRNVTNSWRAVDNNTSMEFKYWNMAANAAELNASVLGCNNNNSAVMNGNNNFCNNTKRAASSMRHQTYNHWLVREAEHRRLSDQLLSERTARNNHPDEGKKKMPTPQALGDGAVGADVRVRCGKLHCQSCYSNDEAGYRLSEV